MTIKIDASGIRGVFRNTIILSAVQALNIMMPFLTLPYVVRAHGLDEFGRLAFSQAYVAFLAVVVDYGFAWSATAKIAKVREDKQKRTELFWVVTTAKCMLLAGCMIVTVVMVVGFDSFKKQATLIWMTVPTLVASIILPQWYLQGVEKIATLLLATLVAKSIALILVVFLVSPGVSIEFTAAILGYSSLMGGVVSIAIFVQSKEMALYLPSWNSVKVELKESWPLFLSNLSIALYSAANLLALGIFSSPTQVGAFSIADKIKVAGQMVVTPFGNALYPRVNLLLDVSRHEGMQLLKRAFYIMGAIGLCVSLGILTSSEIIIGVVAGGNSKAIEVIKPVVIVLSAVPLLVALSNYFGVQVLLTFGRKKTFSRIILTAGLTNMCLLYPASKYYGAVGVGAALLSVELMVSFCMAVMAVKVLKNEK